MAKGDKDFAGKLKIAWDTELKHNNKLILVLCGSVSSWLEENILNSTGFVGRVSLDLKLEELDLATCVQFWGKNHSSISTMENLMELIQILAINPGSIQFASPYFQSKTLTQESCQIDLLIITRHSIYLSEMKFRKKVSNQVIHEVIEKSGKLRIPKHLSVRPVLIYSGDINPVIEADDYFFRIIHMEEFFRSA